MGHFTITLIEPQIPPNTGTIARLCGATDTTLHIVGKCGFDLSDSAIKRAGLDYWHLVDIQIFDDVESYLDQLDPDTSYFFSSKATVRYTDTVYAPGDTLIFGSETAGLSESVRTRFSDQCRLIPMANVESGMRSLNLANCASIVLYEAIRQTKVL